MKKIEIATELVNMMSNNNKLCGEKEYDDDHKSRMVAKYREPTSADGYRFSVDPLSRPVIK